MIPLAKAGFEVIGLDNSEAMLARAREQTSINALEELVHLVRGEITAFDLAMRFPLITVPFNTWLHIPGRQARLSALECISRHLLPGGQLAVDLPAPSTIVDVEHDGAMVLEGVFAGKEEKERLLQFSSTRLDREQQILHVTWIYDLLKANGGLKRATVSMPLHYLFPRQIESSLREVNLKLKTLWGTYDRSPYSAASKNMIVLAEKPSD
jgi:SAM-dependent methyltransferase